VAEVLKDNPNIGRLVCQEFFSRKRQSCGTGFASVVGKADAVFVTRMDVRVVLPLLRHVHRRRIVGLSNLCELRSLRGWLRVAPFFAGKCIMNPDEDLHEAERLWLLAKSVDARQHLPQKPYPPTLSYALVELPPSPYLIIHPGANIPEKCWSLDGFAEVGRILTSRFALTVIVGAEGDRARCDALTQGIPGSLNQCGRYSLPQLATLSSKCALYLGNDTGSTHLAAATGCPIVAIEWDDVQARRWGPYRPHDPTARPVWHRYLNEEPHDSWVQRLASVTIDEVLNACNAVLAAAETRVCH
jgi:ADP-heptose:LPS heptosyltransferase